MISRRAARALSITTLLALLPGNAVAQSDTAATKAAAQALFDEAHALSAAGEEQKPEAPPTDEQWRKAAEQALAATGWERWLTP